MSIRTDAAEIYLAFAGSEPEKARVCMSMRTSPCEDVPSPVFKRVDCSESTDIEAVDVGRKGEGETCVRLTLRIMRDGNLLS